MTTTDALFLGGIGGALSVAVSWYLTRCKPDRHRREPLSPMKYVGCCHVSLDRCSDCGAARVTRSAWVKP